jgi:Ni/Fe-hydrogenase subunit HybB-like protein
MTAVATHMPSSHEAGDGSIHRVRPPRYFTPGMMVVLAVALIGGAAWVHRMLFGLGASTNLTDAYPWGIWIGIDVACGVALAAGGFTTAFLAHLLHRDTYHAVVRPALLTAAIGYTFVALGVMTDLGRFWAMWHVMLPWMWQPNSVLFEVAICVMCYLTVLYIEFTPIVCERFIGRVRLPGPLSMLNALVDRVLRFVNSTLGRVMTVFVILGCLLSCMHQSSLGTLMVIAGDKLHPLWQTPFLPLLFLLSAFAVGYPMVVFESMIAHRSFRLPPDMKVLPLLARYTPIILGLYLGVRIFDLFNRGVADLVFAGTFESNLFLAEVGLGFVAPMLILLVPRLRRSAGWLFAAACLVILGVVMNRLDTFLIAYSPLDPAATYFPAWTEIAVTAGFIAIMVLIYRFVVLNFPVIEHLDVPGWDNAGGHAEPAAAPAAETVGAPTEVNGEHLAAQTRDLEPLGAKE